MASTQFSFRRIEHNTKPRGQVTETYCPACGHLVAASPYMKLLEFVEKIHVCPESRAFAYQYRNQGSGEV